MSVGGSEIREDELRVGKRRVIDQQIDRSIITDDLSDQILSYHSLVGFRSFVYVCVLWRFVSFSWYYRRKKV